jgi:DNA modification methylase
VSVQILEGDCLQMLKRLPSESINTCITSPPYWGLRNYNDEEKQLGMEDTPEDFVENLVKVFREVKRVLRDDGTVWLNLGDSYNTTQAGNKTWGDGVGANKHYVDGSIPKKRNLIQGLKKKDLIGIPWRTALALQNDGWYLRQDIIWNKPNPMPESITDRCTKAHEYIFLLTKKPQYYFDNEAIKEDSVSINSKGEVGKANSTINIGKSVADKEGFEIRDGLKNMGVYPQKNKRSVWTVTTKPYKDAHFATFPQDLIEPCVLAGCPKDGLVLDPFAGSGTTGQVALANNRKAVLIELNAEYVQLIKKRFGIGTSLFDARADILELS